MFWFLSTPSKKNTTHPVKRQVSITTTHVPGTSRSSASRLMERRSQGLTPNAMTTTNYYTSPSTTISEGFEENDDGATEGSSSSGSGTRIDETISELQGSFNHPRHQIDKCTWSNVTSPGFTSRAVSAANNPSPLRESQNHLTASSTTTNNNLRYPTDIHGHGHLKMGEFHPPVWNKPVALAARFPSPISSMNVSTNNHRRLSKSWLFSEANTLSASARHRNRNIDESTSYIRIAPLEPGKNYIPSPPNSNDNINVNSGGSSKMMMGLGGIPQSSLGSRYHQRLLPISNVPYENNLIIRTSSSPPPSPPSNDVLHALANRKRGRPTSSVENINNTSKGSPSSRSLQVCSPDEIIKNNTKRVKFYNQMHDERMNHVPLSVPPNSHDGEPMSTESILEQLNQTEKRFLPHDDDLLKTYGNENKRLRSGPNPNVNNNSAPNSAQRKRRVSNNSQRLEADDPREKTGRFCECNECYLELAGSVSNDHTASKNNNILKETSVVDGISKKSIATATNTNDVSMSSSINSVLVDSKGDRDRSSSSKLCDRGTETDWLHLNARTGTNRPIMTPKSSRSYVVDIEKYKADKLKSIERFNRLLDLHPIKPKEPKNEEKVVENNSTNVLSEGFGNKELNKTPTPTSSGGGFSFGSSTAETVPTFSNTSSSSTVPASFSFGINPPTAANNTENNNISKSPDALSTTTTTTTTFGSGFNFGQNLNSEVTSTSPPSPIPASVVTTTASLSPLFNTQQVESTSATGGFSFGGFPKNGEKPVELNNTANTVPITTTTITTTTISSIPSNFSFGSSIPNSSSAITTSTSSSSAPSFSFGTIGNQQQQATPASTAPTATTGFTFGQPQTQPQQQQQQSNNTGFSFGGMPKIQENTNTNSFSLGGGGEKKLSSSIFPISPETTNTTPSNNTPSFSFGSPAASLSTTTGSNFSFGQNNLGNLGQQSTTTSTAVPTPVVSSSIFSIPNVASPTPSPGVFSFGSSTGNEQQKQNSFMTPSATTSTASSAGAPFSFGSPQTNASSLPSNTNTTGGGSTFSFGQNLGSTTPSFQNPTSTTSTTSLFGASNNTTASSGGFGFGQQQQQVAKPAFEFGSSAPQQSTTSSSLFSAPGGQTTNNNSGFSFAQPQHQQQQQQAPAPAFSFGSTSPPQQTSSFPSLFGSTPTAGSTQANTGSFAFGQTAQQQQPQTQANPSTFTFGSAPAQTAVVSPFSSPTSSGFGQPQQQSNPGFNFGASNQPAGGGFPFAAAAAAPPANTGMFQFSGQQQQPQNQGGFNFTPQTNFSITGAQQPQQQANPMFNVGASSNTSYAARRRDNRRRR